MATDRPPGPQQQRNGNKVFVDGRYYWPDGVAGTTTIAVTAGKLYAVPFLVGRKTTFTKMVLSVTTGAAGFFNMGVYTHDEGSGYPLALQGACATQISDNIAVLEPAFAFTLEDLVWLAIVFSATPTVRAMTASVEHNNALLGTSSNDPAASTDLFPALRADLTYAALPAAFPATPTYISAVSMPKLGLKT